MINNDQVPWILDCCHRLLLTSNGLRKEHVMQLDQVLESICDIATVLSSIQELGLRQTAIADLSTDLLSFVGIVQSPGFESSLARLLISFLDLDLSSPRFSNMKLKERICPLVTQLIQNEHCFLSLGKDLQVTPIPTLIVLLCSIYYSACSACGLRLFQLKRCCQMP